MFETCPTSYLAVSFLFCYPSCCTANYTKHKVQLGDLVAPLTLISCTSIRNAKLIGCILYIYIIILEI